MEIPHEQQPPRPEVAEEEPESEETSCSTKQICLIILVYMAIAITSSFNERDYNYVDTYLRDTIRKADPTNRNIIKDALLYYPQDELMKGVWSADEKIADLSSSLGKAYITNIYTYIEKNRLFYALEIDIYNEEYIDQGVLKKNIYLNAGALDVEIKDNRLRIFKKEAELDPSGENINRVGSMNTYEVILREGSSKATELQELQFIFELKSTPSEHIQASMSMKDEVFGGSITSIQHYQKSNSYLILALLLFMISYIQFYGIVDVLADNYLGHTNPAHYSLCSVVLAMMIDTILSITSFMMGMMNRDNLLLFIIPAFLFCLLFFNRELQLLLQIFQANNQNTSMRRIICKFNLITYGSYIAIYPIMYLTNLNGLLFVALSLLLLPQILLNTQHNIRPTLTNAYYSKFLMPRLIIIFYLRMFPYNAFELQPDYTVSTICALIIAAQIGILYSQKINGPKKYFPRWMLPKIYNYKFEEEIEVNIEEVEPNAKECVICLMNLEDSPESGASDAECQVEYKLMRTPCGHIYHSPCLVSWMRIKQQCPQCRSPLPAYE